MVLANKVKLGPAEALEVARQCSQISVAKGNKLVHINMKKDAPSDDELLALLLGTSGRLRAPTIRSGKRLMVGFSEEMLTETFG